jgi:hypothetical protein
MRRAKLTREVGNWVSGDKFWDRESELQSFIEQLDEAAHMLLTAPRRTGKTSLMREVVRQLHERGRDHALYVDLERSHSPEDAIVEISLATRPYQSVWQRTRQVFHNTLGKVEELRLDELAIKLRGDVSGNWRGKGDRMLETLSTLERPVVLFLDEFPILVNRLLKAGGHQITADGRARTEEFVSWIRAVSLQYQGKIRFVLSGSIGLGPVLGQAALSGMINNFRPFELEPWGPAVAQECMQALAAQYNVNFAPGATERAVTLLGLCIPHHVQMFFSHIYEDCKKRWGQQPAARNVCTTEDIDRVYRTRLLSARGHAELSHFEERLRSVLGPRLLPLAIDLLNEATHGSLTPAASRLLTDEHLGEADDRAARVREVLGILEHDGYVNQGDDGYRFASNLVRDWWRARFGFGFVPTAERINKA